MLGISISISWGSNVAVVYIMQWPKFSEADAWYWSVSTAAPTESHATKKTKRTQNKNNIIIINAHNAFRVSNHNYWVIKGMYFDISKRAFTIKGRY